jgi:quercetin dioxygenase-like cupin family protein
VLIVRFYHLDHHEPDSDSRDGRDRGEGNEEPSPRRREHRVVDQRQRGATRGDSTSRSFVSDRRGLGRLLRLICSEPETPTSTLRSLNYLKHVSDQSNLGYTRARIDRIQHGLSPIKQDELIKLARVFEMAPILLYDFVSPALPNAVVIREAGDWSQVPGEYYANSRGVAYFQPKRRLVNADTSIMLVELDPEAETASHHHPGLEFVVPLSGSVDVKFGDAKVHLSVQEGLSYIHFVSNTGHCIANAGEETAKLLVIRLYELPLAASPPAPSFSRRGPATPGRRPGRPRSKPRGNSSGDATGQTNPSGKGKRP